MLWLSQSKWRKESKWFSKPPTVNRFACKVKRGMVISYSNWKLGLINQKD
jgi:hypothetical protein